MTAAHWAAEGSGHEVALAVAEVTCASLVCACTAWLIVIWTTINHFEGRLRERETCVNLQEQIKTGKAFTNCTNIETQPPPSSGILDLCLSISAVSLTLWAGVRGLQMLAASEGFQSILVAGRAGAVACITQRMPAVADVMPVVLLLALIAVSIVLDWFALKACIRAYEAFRDTNESRRATIRLLQNQIDRGLACVGPQGMPVLKSWTFMAVCQITIPPLFVCAAAGGLAAGLTARIFGLV
eukprot:CAMPEP_0206214860 /NCGR_PEP_ID=MMETSP0047_2-20121206/1889_1 /ASSEMBLY_ACC=CAM_ASM_000192 /TAXON_ID=195065 /ORGANISM="Chroomonas mesostigmatica_cf, Strain CCMP1168" /LENGTH=240 /DNA_ID=CAMNT_0053637121 /DNA_START=723 /DNA_END=1445 /DNA_ORIENTATION=-